jgi:hypothetical protein
MGCCLIGPALPAAAADSGPSNPGSGYVLDFEDPTSQQLPQQLPPGWAREYQPTVVHADGEPQVRVVSTAEGAPVRAGTHAARFELDRSDPPLHNGSRAEISGENPPEPRGVERWYGFSTYLPSSWTVDRTPENIVQWHQVGGDCSNGCSPPLAINTQNGHYVLSQNWQKSLSTPGDWNFEDSDIGPYEVGRWTDWVVHVKWSTDDDGLLQVWKDGVPVSEVNPPSGQQPRDFSHKIGRNDDFGDQVHGNYLVIGIYKWPWFPKQQASDTTNRVLYTDEVRTADGSGSYAQVAPPQAGQPGQPTLRGALHVTPGRAGAASKVTFTVTNTGSTAVTVPYFLAGARTAAGAHVDFPASAPVTLDPGATYTYRASRRLAAGRYTIWPAYYDGTAWHELGAHRTFTVAPKPGHLAVTTALQVVPGHGGGATSASFTVSNDGGTALTLPYVLVGARTAAGGHVDFPTDGPLTLRPGQRHTYRGTRVLGSGQYTAWPGYYDGAAWHELGPHTGFGIAG